MLPYNAERDIYILTAMADQFEKYLIEDEMFWPLAGRIRGGMPRMTLGGYLLRKERLEAIRPALMPDQQATLDELLAASHIVIREWSIHYNTKLDREWDMRINLIENFLEDVNDVETHNNIEHWPNQARQRTVVHLLLKEARQQDSRSSDKVAALARIDRGLKRYLRTGETGHFLWAPELERAFPQETYWWLWVLPQEAPV